MRTFFNLVLFTLMSVMQLGAIAQQEKTTGGSGILEIIITEKISPALGGRIFGEVGTYDLILGRAKAVADPMSKRNTGVVDLKLALPTCFKPFGLAKLAIINLPRATCVPLV